MTLALDLDGTLISCEPRQSAVLRAALVACSQFADSDSVWALKREGLSTKAALVRSGLHVRDATRVAEHWQNTIEDPQWLALDTVLPTVLETLAGWHTDGTELLLLTARSRPEWLGVQLCHLGLARFFSRVERVSPAAAAAEKAHCLRKYRAQAFIGDTESDAAAAQSAEVPFVGISTGQRSASFLNTAGVPNVYSALVDLRHLNSSLYSL